MLRFLATIVAVSCAALARGDDPPRLAPAVDAEPAKAWAGASENHLREPWGLPEGVKAGGDRDMGVICHGTGLDYRWGSANYKPGVFRPEDIVVSVDGPSKANDGSRLFLGNEHDAEAFGDFIVEVSKAFHSDRVYLYGHSQGSFFVCYFL